MLYGSSFMILLLLASVCSNLLWYMFSSPFNFLFENFFWFPLWMQVIQMNIEESARKNIAQELKINQSSQCPYVVVCYQSFYDNGAISIIFEYMDGGSLADFLKKVGSIPEQFLAAICKQVETIELPFTTSIIFLRVANTYIFP